MNATPSRFDRLLSRLGLKRMERQRYVIEGELMSAVQALAESEQRPADQVASELLVSGLARLDQFSETWQLWLLLSEREKQVTALTCLGYTNAQIAGRLFISVDTVKTHVRHALYKFDRHSKYELRILLDGWDFSAWENVKHF